MLFERKAQSTSSVCCSQTAPCVTVVFFKVQTNKEKVYFCIDLVFNVPIYPAIVGDTAGKLKSGSAKN